jgi:hypothetical protein
MDYDYGNDGDNDNNSNKHGVKVYAENYILRNFINL